jgi:hypothetical protein
MITARNQCCSELAQAHSALYRGLELTTLEVFPGYNAVNGLPALLRLFVAAVCIIVVVVFFDQVLHFPVAHELRGIVNFKYIGRCVYSQELVNSLDNDGRIGLEYFGVYGLYLLSRPVYLKVLPNMTISDLYVSEVHISPQKRIGIADEEIHLGHQTRLYTNSHFIRTF